MISAAKVVAPFIAGAFALTGICGSAMAGVPYSHSLLYPQSARAPDPVQHVWWRGGWGWWGPGVAAGVLTGAAIGAATAPYYAYPPGYYYPGYPGYYYQNPCHPGYHFYRGYCYPN